MTSFDNHPDLSMRQAHERAKLEQECGPDCGPASLGNEFETFRKPVGKRGGKRPGAGRKPRGETRLVRIYAFVDPSVKATIQRMAADTGVSTSAMIATMLAITTKG